MGIKSQGEPFGCLMVLPLKPKGEIQFWGNIKFDRKYHFREQLSTSRTEKTTKIRPSNSENNTYTLPRQLQNDFEKKSIKHFFDPPKCSKMTL